MSRLKLTKRKQITDLLPHTSYVTIWLRYHRQLSSDFYRLWPGTHQ